MRVADAMTPIPLTIEPSLPLHKALDVMRENDVRHLLVVDASRKLAGMLSERDIKRHMSRFFETKLEKPGDRLAMLSPVADIMTPDPYTARADQALADVVDMMYRGKFGAVPVVDEAGHPTGILSSIDLLRILKAKL